MNYRETISIINNPFQTEVKESIPLYDFCAGIANEEFKQEIETLRFEKNPARRKKLKEALPCAFISGLFDARGKSRLIKHSGFIAIDIDAKENPHVTDWGEARDRLSTINNVFFAALSASGNGIFLIIPIGNPQNHEKHFDAMKIDFASVGFFIDGSCRDVSRLRFISSDPEARFNLEAKPYNRIPKPDRRPMSRKTAGVNSSALERMIDKIIDAGVDITEGYENWLEVGRAIANEYGERGRQIYHRLSQMNETYQQGKCDRKYDACLRIPGSATGRTIFHLAKANGVTLK